MSSALGFLFPILITAVLILLAYIYGRWLYQNRENTRYNLAPIGVLLGCLLVTALAQSYVFARAEVISYASGVTLSKIEHIVPKYWGEEIPQRLVVVGPIVGFLLMQIRLPSAMRWTQGVHFIGLLLFVYPILALMIFVWVGGSRPEFRNGETPPPIGSKVPTQP